MSTTPSATLLDELAAIVGVTHVLSGDMAAGFGVDWTGRFRGLPRAVVRPGSTDEVAAVVHAARRHGAALVPQGGNTGLVGGGVALQGEVIVSTTRLVELGAVDTHAGQVRVGAGVTLAVLQRHVRHAGWDFAVDFAARDSATIGGMIATNAGGLHVLRHGSMRAQVLGVEAVLGSGSIVRVNESGLLKDNTGYDLSGLLTGSEGTLGIVTASRLRLIPRHDERAVAVLGFAEVGAALEVLAVLRRLESLTAVEVMFHDGLNLVAAHIGANRSGPLAAPVVLLVECAAVTDPTEALGDTLAAAGLLDADPAPVVATDPAARARLWRWRESHTEAINVLGPPVKLDVTLPAGALAVFVAELNDAVADAIGHGVRHTVSPIVFGHLGDGNLHVNVVGVLDREGGGQAGAERVEAAVLRLVTRHRGSISAEHGIGTAKRAYLHLQRSPAELAAFAAIKRALDPDSVCNPHVLFDSDRLAR